MNKQQLVNKISVELNLTKVKSAMAVDVFFETLAMELRRGKQLELRGCGTFSVQKWPARKTVHPQTGKRIFIAAKKNIKFKASAAFLNKIT